MVRLALDCHYIKQPLLKEVKSSAPLPFDWIQLSDLFIGAVYCGIGLATYLKFGQARNKTQSRIIAILLASLSRAVGFR